MLTAVQYAISIRGRFRRELRWQPEVFKRLSWSCTCLLPVRPESLSSSWTDDDNGCHGLFTTPCRLQAWSTTASSCIFVYPRRPDRKYTYSLLSYRIEMYWHMVRYRTSYVLNWADFSPVAQLPRIIIPKQIRSMPEEPCCSHLSEDIL